MTRRHAAPALILLASLAPVACSDFRDPSLRVVNVEVRERTADALVIEFTLEAENANEVPLPLKEFSYSVSLDGHTVFQGFRSPEATLRRFGVQQLRVPAVIPVPEIPDGPATCRLSGTLAYTTPGELAQVLFESDVRRPTVGFSDERELDFSAR
jgi:hypothetical protein